MRSAMRTITDVSIDNRAVDCEEEGYSFIINSDHISFIETAYYDMETHAYSAWTVGNGITSDWGRGDKINLGLSGGFTAGRDYMGVITIFQRQAGDMTEETSTGAYDVYMGAGKLQENSSTATKVYIDKDISFFRSPVIRNDILIGGLVLRLNDRDLLISSYNKETGEATVTGAKINGVTSTTRTTTKGESYKLITNYLICDAFVFYYRTTPEISISTQLTTNGIEVTGTYSQAEGTEIRSWRMWAYYNTNGHHGPLYPLTTIRHEEHFDVEIEDVFPFHAANGYDPEFPDEPATVDIYLEVTTQDGVTVQTHEDLEFLADYPLNITTYGTSSALIRGMPQDGAMFVFRRQNYDTGDNFGGLKYLGPARHSTYAGEELYSVDGVSNGYGVRYKYYISGVDAEGNIYYGESAEVVDPARKWSIGKLTKVIGADNVYNYEGGFIFDLDLQPGAIETVTGNTVYGTEGRFPKAVHGTDRYDTGTFTCLLGTISSPEYSIYNIERWTDYITQGGLYLLKTDVGDVKIITITGDPSRQYGSTIAEMGLTRITYSWAEVLDVNEVEIR